MAGIGKIEAQTQENNQKKAEIQSRISKLSQTYNVAAPADKSSLKEQQHFLQTLTNRLAEHASTLDQHKKNAFNHDNDFERTIASQNKQQSQIQSKMLQLQEERKRVTNKEVS